MPDVTGRKSRTSGSITMIRAWAAAALVTAASVGGALAQEKRGVVYTAHNTAIVDLLQPRFEKETGIKIDLVKAGSGDIIKRVKAESAAPKADVIWSIGAETLEDNKDLLTPYTPKDSAAMNPAYKASAEWIPYTGIVA